MHGLGTPKIVLLNVFVARTEVIADVWMHEPGTPKTVPLNVFVAGTEVVVDVWVKVPSHILNVWTLLSAHCRQCKPLGFHMVPCPK